MNKFLKVFSLLLLVIFIGALSSCANNGNNNINVDGVWIGQWRASGNPNNEDQLILAHPDFIWLTPISESIGTFYISDGEITFAFTDGFGGEITSTRSFSFTHSENSIAIDSSMRFIRESD